MADTVAPMITDSVTSGGPTTPGDAPAPVSLRGFLEMVRTERKADYVEVSRRVSPRFETAAIVTALEAKRRSPILVFRDVEGTSLPVVTNVGGSMGRLALALGCSLSEVGSRFEQAAARRIEPVEVAGQDAPVHEVVQWGEEVDLGWLPPMVYHADDNERPYLTAAMVVARDPETGIGNLSYHRMMILGRDRTGIYMERGRHLHGIYEKHRARGEAMPIAVVNGLHPAVTLGSLYAGTAEVDEYEIIGGLLGRPLPVARTVTGSGLLVPAMKSTMTVTSMIFATIIAASIFSLVFIGLGGEERIEQLLTAMPGGPTGALIFCMLLIFVLGFFLDFVEITVIVLPLVAPLLILMGHDPVWLSILIAINLQTSFLTPPFGFSLFYLRGAAPPEITTGQIYAGVAPFILLQIVGVAIIWFLPAIPTYLPSVLFP